MLKLLSRHKNIPDLLYLSDRDLRPRIDRGADHAEINGSMA